MDMRFLIVGRLHNILDDVMDVFVYDYVLVEGLLYKIMGGDSCIFTHWKRVELFRQPYWMENSPLRLCMNC
ncbi:hypothetical protein CR513_53504, partial [Mucuna pruriens]